MSSFKLNTKNYLYQISQKQKKPVATKMGNLTQPTQQKLLFDIKLDINSQKGHPDNSRYENKRVLKNNFIFAIAVIIMQVFVCFLYGFLYEEPIRDITLYNAMSSSNQRSVDTHYQFLTNFGPVFIVFGIAIFVLVGFGLVISYSKRLALSGLGFTLLVSVLTIEWYFLFNAFWAKGVQAQNSTFNQKIYPIYLTNMEVFPTQTMTAATTVILQTQKNRIRATLTQALKCSLANSIIFSSILGRAGPLQAFIISTIGTIGYQINARLVVERIGMDYGHTYRVFLFAGIAGLVVGWMLRSRHQTLVQQTTIQHPNYVPSRDSVWASLFGSLVIWLIFPIFILDPTHQQTIIQSTSAHVHNSWISLYHSMAASLTTSIGISLLLHGKTKIRDIILAPLAGGIAVASASPYLVQPVWPILIGSIAGAIQCLSNLLQKQQSQSSNIVNTFSFTVFGFNGLLGAVWASIFRAAIQNRPEDFQFVFNRMMPASGQFLAGLATIGIGLSFGFIIGIFVSITGIHKRMDHFRDYTYWSRNDGLNIILQRQTQSNICPGSTTANMGKNEQITMDTKSLNNILSSQISMNKIDNTKSTFYKTNNVLMNQQPQRMKMIKRNRRNLLRQDQKIGEQHEWMESHYRDEDVMRILIKPQDMQKAATKPKGKIKLEPLFIKTD